MNYKLKPFKLLVIIIIFAATCLSERNIALAAPKNRIISLTPASTEILFALGLKDEVIAVSNYCNWPLEAADKEKIGSFSRPDIEKIILIKPDLVVLTGTEQEYLKKILHNLGIDYIVVDPSDLNGLIVCIEKIGNITNRKKEAKELTGNIRETIYEVKKAVANIPQKKRPRVYLEIWHDPIMSPGEKSLVSDMIETAGGINITKDIKRSYSRIDPEAVILRDPDVIILTYMKPGRWINNSFAKRIGWQKIKAVINNKIFADINPDIILRPGPRVKEGLMELYKRFYEN